MAVRTVSCSSCGAPIETSRFARSAVCGHCRATVFIDPDAVERARFRDAFAWWQNPAAQGFAAEDIVRVGDRTWALRQRIGRGRTCDVHAGTLARWPSERVVVKLARIDADPAGLAREHEVLQTLQRSTANGAEHLALRVPMPVVRGIVDGGSHGGRHALVLRWISGFVHTLVEVRLAHPQGVSPRAAVWMWRRVLESLAFAHRSGVAHGGITPARLLVHAREHGVMVVGWGLAREADATACADDLAATARAIDSVLAGADTPRELAALVADVARSPASQGDAWALRERVGQVAEACFGPPQFEHFAMPGW